MYMYVIHNHQWYIPIYIYIYVHIFTDTTTGHLNYNHRCFTHSYLCHVAICSWSYFSPSYMYIHVYPRLCTTAEISGEAHTSFFVKTKSKIAPGTCWNQEQGKNWNLNLKLYMYKEIKGIVSCAPTTDSICNNTWNRSLYINNTHNKCMKLVLLLYSKKAILIIVRNF